MAEEIKIMLAIGIMFLMILSFAVQWIPASATALLAAISMVFCRFLSPAELAASFGADASHHGCGYNDCRQCGF